MPLSQPHGCGQKSQQLIWNPQADFNSHLSGPTSEPTGAEAWACAGSVHWGCVLGACAHMLEACARVLGACARALGVCAGIVCWGCVLPCRRPVLVCWERVLCTRSVC